MTVGRPGDGGGNLGVGAPQQALQDVQFSTHHPTATTLAAGSVPLTCAGSPWRRLQVGSDGALLGCDGPPRSGQPSVTTSTRLQYGVSLSMRPGANRREHASGIERRIQV